MPGIVGRADELSLVHGLIGDARDGRGAALLVAGEAGVGKSRLLAEAVRDGREAGLLVLTGRAVAGGGAYRPLAMALGGVLRDDPDVGGEELRPYRPAFGRMLPCWTGTGESFGGLDQVVVLGEGLRQLFRALNGGRGCLLLLEDLHWADAETMAVLEYLAATVRDCPVLLAGSVREEESSPVRWAHTVRLRRLDEADTLELARRCAGGVLPDDVRQLVLDKSDGLPFLVEELVAGGPGVPPTLAGMVAGRLAELSYEQRGVLQAAAVLGGDPDWTLLETVTGAGENAVLSALRAARPQLVVPAGEALRWRHALTREAVLETLTPPERAVLARRSAEALLGRTGMGVRAAELLAAAGDDKRAASVYLRLAREDLERGALRDAGTLLERAGDGIAVVVERVRLLTLLGRAAEAVAEGSVVLDEATGDDHARLCVSLAEAAIALRRWDDGARFLRRAGRPDDPHVLVLAADAAFGPGDLPRAARLARAAIDLADGNVEARCRALIILGRCAMRRDMTEARAAYEQAAQLAAEHGLRPWRVTALINLATVEMAARPVSPLLEEARELAVRMGRLAEVIVTELLSVEGVLLAEGPRAAETRAREAAAQAERLRLPVLQTMAESFAAYGRADDGDAPGMRAALAAAARHPGAPVEVAAMAPMTEGHLRLVNGDLTGTVALFDEGIARLRGHEQAAPVWHWGLWALLRTVLGDRDDAARTELRGSYAVLRVANRGALNYADAVAAGRAARHAEAAALLSSGDALLAEHHWWRRLCRTLVMRSAIEDGWGDPVPALRADLAAFEHTGEAYLARMCRDLLRRAGAPTRRSRGTTPVPVALRRAGVTSRETDVLGLLTEGLTNRQIAERLFLSPRTVDTHVANLLAKTGTADRFELRTLAPDALAQ
jgi:DNA-binding CsgD family transcriptional regulator